jgi:Flp pilus assembly protein TadD
MEQYPEYRARYWKVAKQLEATEPNDVVVLEALADSALAHESAEGKAAALRYLERAIKNGANAPVDFERLATLLVGAGRAGDAVEPLRRGIRLAPFDVTLYRQLAGVYVALGRSSDAAAILRQAGELFPQNVDVRKLLDSSGALSSAP